MSTSTWEPRQGLVRGSDREPPHYYDQQPIYAAVPTEDSKATHEESEDDVQIFMVGELYEPGAESSSATSSDHGTEDEHMPQTT